MTARQRRSAPHDAPGRSDPQRGPDAALHLRPGDTRQEQALTDLRRQLAQAFAAGVTDIRLHLEDDELDLATLGCLRGAQDHLTARAGRLTVQSGSAQLVSRLRMNGLGALVAASPTSGPSRQASAAPSGTGAAPDAGPA